MVTMEGALTPKNSASIDQVEVTFILRESNGNIKYNQKHVAVWNGIFKRYEISKKYHLSKNDFYTLQVRYDAYRNGSRVETIYSDKITKLY